MYCLELCSYDLGWPGRFLVFLCGGGCYQKLQGKKTTTHQVRTWEANTDPTLLPSCCLVNVKPFLDPKMALCFYMGLTLFTHNMTYHLPCRIGIKRTLDPLRSPSDPSNPEECISQSIKFSLWIGKGSRAVFLDLGSF